MERKVLASLLQNRKVYDLVAPEIDVKDLSPEGQIIFGLCSDFYEADKAAERCDVEILVARTEREVQSNKIGAIIVGAVRDLCGVDVSTVNVGREVLAVKQASLGSRIASRLAAGKADPVIKEFMNEYLRLDERVSLGAGSEDEEEFIGTSAADLGLHSFNQDGLLALYPMALNKQIDGGLRGGHHVLIFAPTEMGKSLFAINACYGFLRQGARVLYVGNEDPAPDILMRMMSRLTLRTKYEILDDPSGTDKILAGRNWNDFVFANLSPGTFGKVRRLVEKHTPRVVILDQLRNIDVGVEQRTQALEKAATEARNLAKKFNIPVLSVTQAGDSASGKTILTRGDVDGSNVGIPGQVDLMIGMGANSEMEEGNLRMLSFPKNKLSGNHTPITITIDPFTSRIIEHV
jgi:archaellum biogenesis ATPase FlaH